MYFVLRDKRALFKDVVDLSIAGDAEPVATMDRDWFRAACAEPTAAGSCALTCGAYATSSAVSPRSSLIAAAAATDPEKVSCHLSVQQSRPCPPVLVRADRCACPLAPAHRAVGTGFSVTDSHAHSPSDVLGLVDVTEHASGPRSGSVGRLSVAHAVVTP
ncbi:hypothetical protein STHAL_25400 [Streptomyces halstedii]|uniref:Uncharacterized protein n=1 Tax=Streptomyces halstedii TaxID=1944 RepID=A0ABS6TWY6_STRHA|nr:hypothetical protein [Streptomyces halstedii]MBV7672784.1 hypothetical protein [Streptomyces halstedii]